jgi:hypothetical protein
MFATKGFPKSAIQTHPFKVMDLSFAEKKEICFLLVAAIEKWI